MNSATSFVRKNWKYIAVAVLLLVLILVLTSKEGFEGMNMGDLAEYPKIFLERVVEPFAKEFKTTGMYSSSFDPKPMIPAISQLNIESQIQSVMIDIGNGTAVEAPVHIPAQTIENIESQTVIKYVEPKETDVIVAAQVVQLPEQEGVIKAGVNEQGDYIQVPVVVPAQTVVIPEQIAVETTMEKFHI